VKGRSKKREDLFTNIFIRAAETHAQNNTKNIYNSNTSLVKIAFSVPYIRTIEKEVFFLQHNSVHIPSLITFNCFS